MQRSCAAPLNIEERLGFFEFSPGDALGLDGNRRTAAGRGVKRRRVLSQSRSEPDGRSVKGGRWRPPGSLLENATVQSNLQAVDAGQARALPRPPGTNTDLA